MLVIRFGVSTCDNLNKIKLDELFKMKKLVKTSYIMMLQRGF